MGMGFGALSILQGKQGRSQPHSPGGQEFHFHHFPQIVINFSYFRVGDSPTREGPGYTPL